MCSGHKGYVAGVERKRKGEQFVEPDVPEGHHDVPRMRTNFAPTWSRSAIKARVCERMVILN